MDDYYGAKQVSTRTVVIGILLVFVAGFVTGVGLWMVLN